MNLKLNKKASDALDKDSNIWTNLIYMLQFQRSIRIIANVED